MQLKFKRPANAEINKIRYSSGYAVPADLSLGRSSDVNDYTDDEIRQMCNGFFTDTKWLVCDGDYAVNLNEVTKASCVLKAVSYFKKPTAEDYKTNLHNHISNIRTFYVEGYFLHTEKEFHGKTMHRITGRLLRAGAINQGRAKRAHLFSVSNAYKSMHQFPRGKFPKDLFYPIKHYINGLFFNDDYRIPDFFVESSIKVFNRQG